MLPKDYVRLKLTGERATDVTDASGTLMLNVAKRTWSDELLQALEFDQTILPSLYESQEVCGKISDAGAAETRLIAGTHVLAGA
jgi:xylulokinase